MAAGTVPTMLALPAELLERMDRAIREGRAQSREDPVEVALRRQFAIEDAAAIDAAFAAMAEDEDYQDEARALTAEFADADWEALRLSDAHR